jgi:hypothetical protein
MSLTTSIAVENDTASPWLAKVRANVSPHRIAAEVGPRCTRLVQRNFRKYAGGANAKGWPSTHFYGRAAEATNWQEGFGFVQISVNQIGIRQRLLGGTIKPVNAGALTIPNTPEAYGKTAREFSNLQFKMLYDPETGHVRPALVEKAGVIKIKLGRKKKDGSKSATPVSTTTGMVALFWLAKSVTQEPNPNVMPTEREFEMEFDKSVDALLRDTTRGGLAS